MVSALWHCSEEKGAPVSDLPVGTPFKTFYIGPDGGKFPDIEDVCKVAFDYRCCEAKLLLGNGVSAGKYEVFLGRPLCSGKRLYIIVVGTGELLVELQENICWLRPRGAVEVDY